MPTSITVLDADGGDQTVATNDAIVAALAALATQATLASILTALGSALPLSTGAATQATLAAILTALGSALPLPTNAATQTTLASVLTALQAAIPAGTNVIGGVLAASAQGTLTDRSGAITAGGTAQQLAAVNANRKYLFVQNNSAAALWINFTTTAVQSQPSISIAAGAYLVFTGNYITTELVSIIGATTGQAFTAKEG